MDISILTDVGQSLSLIHILSVIEHSGDESNAEYEAA